MKNIVIPISCNLLLLLHTIGVMRAIIKTLPITFSDINSPLKNTNKFASRHICNTTASPSITLWCL